jgi:hypothetical protein
MEWMLVTMDWMILWKEKGQLKMKEFDSPFDARDWRMANHPDAEMYHLIRW